MSLLDHPDAQALLADAVVTPEQVRGCQDRLTAFLQRYLPRFYRAEQRTHATLVIRGLLSGLQRKTCEPIAVEAGVHRKPVQNFVGSGGWDDEAVMAELRGHVREVLADPRGGPDPRPQRLPQVGEPSRAGWPGSGAAGWASRTTASSASSSPTPPPAATRRWTAGCTCPRTGPPTRAAARSATSPRP